MKALHFKPMRCGWCGVDLAGRSWGERKRHFSQCGPSAKAETIRNVRGDVQKILSRVGITGCVLPLPERTNARSNT